MAVRPEADRAYFAARPEEHALAHRLDEAFDVTFGQTHGELAFWLAEPKDHAKERFGLQQEVLVIFSPHSRTDARVLTAIENITRHPDFRHRTEKILFLLIHKGFLDETQELVRTQTERIIVPVGVEELLNPQRGSLFLRKKISDAVGAIDLFGVSSPITSDKNFFGREDLVQHLVNRSAARRDNTGLFGLRKTGKTSVLFAVQRRVTDHPVLIEYFDCQNPGIHAARWWQVLENISTRCSETLKRQFHRSARIIGGYTPANGGTLFSSDIKAILEEGKLEQTILMLDEVEYITHGLSGALGRHWDEDFVPLWQTIRAAHQETKGQVSFIVAEVNPACVEKSHFGATPNPIFQLAAPLYLEPLSVGSVRSMVRSIGRYAGLRFDEEVYPQLQETYGGHPYLIRIACSELWKVNVSSDPESTKRLGVKDLLGLRTELKARMAQPIKDILLSLVWWYPDEYGLLQILASGDHAFVAEYLKESPESMLQFARYGVLRPDTGRFMIADIREFLNEHGETYKREISPFIRTDMPLELLPEVPDLESLGRLFEKRTEIETALRKVVLMYLGVKHAWAPDKIAKSMIKGLHVRE